MALGPIRAQVRFRTKLLLTFLVVGLLTNGISLGLLYYLARKSLYDFYRAKLLSVTVSVATMIDAEKLKAVQTSEDAQTPAYAELRDMLRNVRNANRRKDTYFERIFTVMRSSHDPSVLLFGVDSEERPEDHGRLGESIARAPGKELISIKRRWTISTSATSSVPSFRRTRQFAIEKENSSAP